MKIFELSPEAYGTLRALWSAKSIEFYEERAAKELVTLGYAEHHKNRLRVTGKGSKVSKLFKPPPREKRNS